MDQAVKKFKLEDLLQISLPAFKDDRGFFKEVLRVDEINQVSGMSFVTKQVNHSRSSKNTLRGIHIAPWNKIIYVTRGEVQAVIADCRKGSPTFGQYESIFIGDVNKSCVFIPAFLGNSYLVLSEEADYIYLTDAEWKPNMEKSIAWNDPVLNIRWQLEGEPKLSGKDKGNPLLSALVPEFK